MRASRSLPSEAVHFAGAVLAERADYVATSDIYCFADGVVSEVNKAVVDDPSLLNSDPLGKGWLVKIKVTSKGKLGECMDGPAYDKAHPGH